ncbi:MAG: nucleotidyltransferase domain-containing protein [Pseudomonadota bacterium]|uniref:nucleotidyltransferase domain-containing protein n=1 Tax=Roseovarius sp. TaxID=1486281 RepID=UPI003561EAC0
MSAVAMPRRHGAPDSERAALLATLPRPMQRLIAALASGVNPQAIDIFGSRVTGLARTGSDIDLILLIPGAKVDIDTRKEAGAITCNSHVGADVLLVTEAQFKARTAAPLSFLGSIKPKQVF